MPRHELIPVQQQTSEELGRRLDALLGSQVVRNAVEAIAIIQELTQREEAAASSSKIVSPQTNVVRQLNEGDTFTDALKPKEPPHGAAG